MRTETQRIYYFRQQLDTDKEYQKTREAALYPFSISMPPMAGVMQIVTDPLHGFTISMNGFQIGGGPGPIGPP